MGVGGGFSAAPAGHFGRRGDRCMGSALGVIGILDTRLPRKRGDDFPGGLLWGVRPAFPAVDGGERHTQAIGELLLSQVQFSTDGSEEFRRTLN